MPASHGGDDDDDDDNDCDGDGDDEFDGGDVVNDGECYPGDYNKKSGWEIIDVEVFQHVSSQPHLYTWNPNRSTINHRKLYTIQTKTLTKVAHRLSKAIYWLSSSWQYSQIYLAI